MAAINLDIGGNTSRLDRDIQKTVNKAYSINLKTKGDQPLGRITGKVNEFNKSLDASNARVIAFGASAGIIFGLQRAFSSLVTSTIEVQKSLQDINVILNVSTTQLNKFGSELFNIAKNTGQSFQEVAGAATEFSRQGLGLVETLKRTNEALILSRLSGLDTVKSVQALTAAVNSFASQAVTATEIVNKFANVDAAFAVSSADLADAISRVGSSAAQSGVSLNELIALVTSAQQTTARGGAVIGNSFKTIFTRLQRGKVVDLLGTLGISDTTAGGEIKSTIQLLQELGAVYDNLGAQQQAYVAEQVGGVFQINILKAALADLGKEYSVYSSALSTAEASTDQAIKRNEQLNKTYAAQLNALQQNAKQLATGVGNRVLGPVFDRVVGGANELLGGVNESDGKSIGAVLGKGILDGLGQLLAGPGLVLLGGILLKLTKDFAKFGLESGKGLLGLNSAATQQKNLQESIGQILQNNPKLIDRALKSEQGLNQVANSLYATLQKQTLELQNQEKISQRIAKAFYGAGVRSSGGVPVVPTSGKSGKPGKAAGHIPNFALGVSPMEAIAESSTAINKGGYRPGPVDSIRIGGQRMVYNKATGQPGVGENIVKYPGAKEPGIVPPEKSKAGNKYRRDFQKASGFDPYTLEGKASGFIPNFADDKNIYKSQKKFAAGKVFDNAIALSLRLKSAYLEDRDIIDFPPNQLSASVIDKRVKEGLGINRQTLYGDAKLSDSESNKASYISKILRLGGKLSGGPNEGYTVTPSGPGGSILVPGSDKKKLADKKQNLRAGVGAIIKKNPSLENYFNQRGIEKGSSIFLPNVLIDYVSGITGKNVFGAVAGRGKNFNDPNVRASAAQSIASRFNRAAGFIPNFAKTKNAINLGNLDTIPNQLGNKVVSLIHPGLSEGYQLRPATAKYLKNEYTGKIPVAGINQTKLKSQIPDLDKNLGDLLVKEANQFGQSLGGSNFLKSAEDLPNYGAAKGAVGVAFEGGVQTLLQQKVGRKQNAGIDFRSITPRLRSIFNEAPGMYDAKSSPALTNEVFKKLLNETRPGATVQKSSGQAGKEYAAKRSAAVDQLRKEGVTGSVAIRQALRDRFGIVGKAAGYIPNFAAEEDAKKREMSRAGSAVTLYSDMLASPVVVNKPQIKKYGPNADKIIKKDHINKGQLGTRSNLMKTGSGKEKYSSGKSRGFIPNFAEDVSAAPIGSTIGAFVAQLGFLAFFLKDIRTDMATAHTEAIESATNEITQDKARLDSLKTGTAEHDKLNKKIKSSTESLKKMEAGSGKVASGLMASASTIMIAAPMLAALAKNAIGSETKGARAAGSAVEGVGQGLAMTSMATMLATTRKMKGIIGKLGFVATVAISAFGGLKELGTDLPELARAAEKASQKLSEFENIGQQANTSFEQIADLRNKGQAKEAGTVENKILTDIAKQVTDPKVASQMQRAIINQDPEALRKAIEENTKVLREERDKTDRSAAVSAGIEGIKSQSGGFLSKGNVEKQISEARNIFTSSLFDLKSATKVDESGKKARSTGVERFNQLQSLGKMNEFGGSKEYEKILQELGFEGEELKALMRNEKAIRPLLQKLINEQIEAQAAQLRNTEEGNSVVKQISAAMRNVRSKYDEYSKAITQGVNNQISANSDIKNALARIQVGKLESNAEITEAFTGGGSTATRQAKTGAELAKIDSDFTANINEPITEATRTLFDILKSSVSTKVGEMATPGDNQTSALMNLDKLQASLPDLLESLNIENLQGILPSANEDFQGFDVKKILDTVRPQVQGEDATKGLEDLEKQLNTANSILYEQRRIQQEQKVLLAQQKFTEIAKLFIAGIKESMGGFEGFLKGNFNEDSKALQDAASAIRIIGSNPQTRGGQVEVGRNLGIVTTVLSKLSGLNIGEELAKFAPNVIAQIEGGQSKYIEDNLNTVFNSLAGLDEGIAQAFRTSLGKKFGLGDDASNKEIADATAKAQTSMQYELVPAISESIRKASIDQLKKDGGNEELIKLLESPASAFLDPQSYTNIAIQESNGILRDILAAISEPVEGLNKPSEATPSSESGRGRAGGGGGGRPRQASDTGGAAGGFFPAFANSKESIIPNFKQQYEKEKRDQLKYGYSGGKPLPLSEENFNPLRDAIANPMQMALLGGMKSKSLGAAGGYFPNFAFISQERINKLLNAARNGTPPEKRNAIDALKRLQKAGKLPPGVLSGGKIPPLKNPESSSKKGPRLALPGPAARPSKPVPLTKPAKSLAKKLPFGVGPAVGALIAYSDYQENSESGMDSTEAAVRAALDFGGSLIGGALGTVGGAALGVGAASIPFAIGGGIAGSAYGTFISRLIADAIYPDSEPIDPTANPIITPPKGPTVKFNNSKRPTKQKKSEKPDKKQLDEMKQAMGPKLPSPDERKAIADREIQAQLIRWQMGASAEFKNYDKDYNATGIVDMYGMRGQVAKGSNIDTTKRITELNDRIKQSRNPRESERLARQVMALRNKTRSDILPKNEFMGQRGEGIGAKKIIEDAIASESFGPFKQMDDGMNGISGEKLSKANLEGLQRAITNKSGQVVGYSRRTVNPQTSFSGPGSYPQANKLIGGKGDSPATQVNTRTGTGTTVPRAEAVTGGYREYSGPPGVYVDGKPYVPPYSEKSSLPKTSGPPGVYVDDKLWTPPEERNKILVGGNGDMPAKQVNAKTGKSMQVPRAMPAFKMGGAATELGTQIPNPTTDFAKLERTIDKEQEEAGVPRSQIYPLNLPELVTPQNPNGTAVFNKPQEGSIEEARKAVKRSFVGGGGKFGGGGASASYAGGYFPNFAQPSSTSNNVNVSVGVNITAGASASSIDKDALSAQIQTLLEVEVPKLNALQARVDRMGEVVTKVQEGNPGKYNLPPKQVA
jgi:TP901 family phage tail tape measure protein